MSILLNLITEATIRLREASQPEDMADLLGILVQIQEASSRTIVELIYYTQDAPGKASWIQEARLKFPDADWQELHAVRVHVPFSLGAAEEDYLLRAADPENSLHLMRKQKYRRLGVALDRWQRAIASGLVTIPGSEAGEEPRPVWADNQPKGIPLAEANIRVRDWLDANAKENPLAVTRDAVASATGVSGGQVSNTSAWKAFQEGRSKLKQGSIREVPLSEEMQVFIPSDIVPPDELAALIEEQRREVEEEQRPYKRRHKSS